LIGRRGTVDDYKIPNDDPLSLAERLSDSGWIKLWRKTLDSAVSDDIEMLGCWTWLLLNANWDERQLLSGDVLAPGELAIGVRRLAAAWGCGTATAHKRLQVFKNLKMVRTRNGTRCTIITVCNWGTYQDTAASPRTLARTISERSPNDPRTIPEHKEELQEGKNQKKKNPPTPRGGKFAKPTVEEVQAYCFERNNGISAEQFVDHYASNGWRVGPNPMKDWRAAVRTWERKDRFSQPQRQKTKYAQLPMKEK
jgi:hypothetical protein